MDFKASLDFTAKLMTLGLCALFALLVVRRLYALSAAPDRTSPYGVLLQIAILFAIPLLAYLFSPQRYRITDSAFIIQRPLRSIAIPFEEIRGVEALAPDQLSGSIRYLGVGGLFGYYGRFWRDGLGRVTFYLRNKTNPVAIDTARGERIIVSSDSPDMARALRKAWQG
jgi:Bacterial PH domain